MATEDLSPRLIHARQDPAGQRTDDEFERLLACVAEASGLDLDWCAMDADEWARFIDPQDPHVAILMSRHSGLCFVNGGYASAVAACDPSGVLNVVEVSGFDDPAYRASEEALVAFCGSQAAGSIAAGAVDPEHLSLLDLWYLCP